MATDAVRESVSQAMRGINQAWLEGRPEDLAPLLHPDVVMVFPGFAGKLAGREHMVSGFQDFCRQARVHDYREGEFDVEVAGRTAVVHYAYELVYERDGVRYRASGRDLWVFEDDDGRWLATWRTMLETAESPA